MHTHKDHLYAQTRASLSTHLPALDGIRGLAVLIVVFHNVADKGVGEVENALLKLILMVADSGWIGVELFFVLSGFLITGILLDGKNSQHQLRNFYIRRGLRILPLYYIFLIIIFIILPLIGMVPSWLDHTREHEVWYWLYLINWVQPFYNDIEMGHFWSLAIEEQFYLLWPILVIHVSTKRLVSVCMGLIISAIMVRFSFVTYLPEIGEKIAYTFTIARYDALAVGALVAIIFRNNEWFEQSRKYILKITIVLLITIACLTWVNRAFAPASGYVGFINQTLIALLCGIVIFSSVIAHTTQPSYQNSLLSSMLLRSFGKYSYAIYIIHVPIKFIWFPQFALDPMAFNGLSKLLPMAFNFSCVLLISSALAYLSWRIIEQPCLRYKRHFL